MIVNEKRKDIDPGVYVRFTLPSAFSSHGQPQSITRYVKLALSFATRRDRTCIVRVDSPAQDFLNSDLVQVFHIRTQFCISDEKFKMSLFCVPYICLYVLYVVYMIFLNKFLSIK